MKKIGDPLQNDFGTLSQKTGLKLKLICHEGFYALNTMESS